MADMEAMPTEQVQSQDTQGYTQSVETAPAVSQPVTQQEKMLAQGEVDKIVKRRHHEGYEKGRQEALAEFQRQQASSQSSHQPQERQQPYSIGGMQQLTPDSISQIVEERIAKQFEARSAMERATQTVNQFINKVSQGPQKYNDFNTVVNETFGDFQEFPEIAELANAVDNTADVIYELAKNPAKISSLLYMRQRSERLALADIQAFSKSIKDNQAGMNHPKANAPLSQVTPSPAGLDDGPNSISDFRKQDWLQC